MKRFKKATAIVLSFLIFSLAFITSPTTFALYGEDVSIGESWYFGNNRTTAFTNQGENGFYAMYSTSISMGSNFPTESAVMCEYDSNDHYFKIPDGNGGYIPNFKIASSMAGYEVSQSFTKAVELADGYSSVIRWVAPKSGEYLLNVEWRGDGGGILSANNDGVTLGIYKNCENLYSNNVSEIKNYAEGPKWCNSDKTILLNKGDSLFFVSDPKNIGWRSDTVKDTPWVNIEITFSAQHSYSNTVSVGDSWYFGNNRTTAFTSQGENGFYAMYSTKTSMGNSFPIDSALLCDYDSTDYYFKISDQNGGYIPNFKIGSSQSGYGTNMAFTKTVELSNGYSSIIKWVAPADGEYKINVAWRGNGDGILSANNDGVILGVYKNKENLYNNQITEIKGYAAGPEWNNQDNVISLNKDDALYFVSDPKSIGWNSNTQKDTPWVTIGITYFAQHSFGEKIIDVEMTYETAGSAHSVCNTCGYTFYEVLPTTDIGDVNGDYLIDIQDLVLIKKLIADHTPNNRTDVNMDGLCNAGDIVKMRQILLGEDIVFPDGGKEYIFGDDAFNGMAEQGTDNFYVMFVNSSNHGAGFPVENLTEMTYFSKNPRQWMPDNAPNTYMYIRSSGEAALRPNQSMAVKWVAPESRTYYIDSFFYGGTRDREAENDDGIAFGAYKNTERLAYVNKTSAFWIEKDEAKNDLSQHIIRTVEMQKGDVLYFTADPKGIIKSSDYPRFYINIRTSNEEIDYMSGMATTSAGDASDVVAYPAPAEFPQYDVKYIVKVNGQNVGVYSDMNSWEKSVNFASFEMREGKTVTVEVTPMFAYKSYKILPDKYGIESNRNGNSITFELSDSKAKLSFVFDNNYKNTTLHLFANPIDDSAPTNSSENVIYFGPGYHTLTESLKPKSNQTVYIANGAVVNGSIYISQKENIGICGSGVLTRGHFSENKTFRGIRVIDSNNINISGVIVNIHGVTEWSTEIRRSTNVTLTNYKTVSPKWASTDGIDIINSQQITVEDCFLRATDDTITLKGLEWDGVSTSTLNAGISGIRVNNTILWNECNSAMVVGEENLAKYYSDIEFTNIDVLFSYDDIYYHEALYERAVISIISGHGCTFEDIHWENIRVNMCERLVCFAFIDEFYTIPVGEYCQALPGYMKNITVKNVTSNSTSDNIYANQIFLKGWNADKTISNITFDNLIIKGEKLTAGSPLIVKNEYVSEITVE